MRTPPCPAVTEAPRARTCNPAQPRDRRNLGRPRDSRNLEVLRPHRERNEWAIGRLRPTPPARTGALSAAFGTAAQRGRIAITDIRASDQPGAEGLRVEEDSAEAAEPGLAVAEATVAAEATVVVGTDRSDRKPWQT
jgi:hypothetical protein